MTFEAKIDRAKLDSWVRRYGTSSNSYVLLEGPKSYFTSPGVDGFLAYQLSGGIALMAGDPVCAPEQAAQLIRDFTVPILHPGAASRFHRRRLKHFAREVLTDGRMGK